MNPKFPVVGTCDQPPLKSPAAFPEELTLTVHDLQFSDGATTPVWRHPRRERCRGMPLLYLHGIQSHPGWFVGSAAVLAGEGWDVFMLTRRGSGNSSAHRGHAPSAKRLLADLDEAAELMLRETSAETLWAVGVSWGGKWLAGWLAGGRADVASAVLVAPGLAPKVDVSISTKLAIIASLLCCPKRQFELPLGEPELFTDNPEMQRYIADDPASLREATARFLYASRKIGERLRRGPAGAISTPVTMLLAADDRIIDNARTQQILDRAAGSSTRTHILPGAHTLEFEPDPTPFYDALVSSLAPGVPTEAAS